MVSVLYIKELDRKVEKLPSWINHNRSVDMKNYWTVRSWLITTVHQLLIVGEE